LYTSLKWRKVVASMVMVHYCRDFYEERGIARGEAQMKVARS